MIEIDQERLGLDSASSAYARRRCPGRTNLIRALKETNSLPPQEPDADAQSGSIVHLAWCGRYSGQLTPMQAETLRSLERMEKMLVADWAGHDEYTLLGREVRLWLHHQLEPVHSGQFDVAYGTLHTKRMLILDGKTLFSEVSPAEENDQLRELVALARFNFPQAESFTVAILQPWVSQRPSLAHYDQAEAELALRLLKLSIAEAADPDAPRIPGAWCKHCPACSKCEEAKAHVGATHRLAQRIERGEIALPIGANGARVLDSIETAEITLRALKASYSALLTKEPDAVPGWYMKAGNQVREIKDVVQAFELARANTQLAPQELLKSVKLSVTALEALVCQALGWQGKSGKDNFNALFNELISFKENAPTLAKESARKGRHKEVLNDELTNPKLL